MDVDGDINFTGTLRQNGNPVNLNGGSEFWASDPNGILYTGGNIGIGMTNPSASLNIYKDHNGGTMLDIHNPNTGPYVSTSLKLYNGSNNVMFSMDGSGVSSIRRLRATIFSPTTEGVSLQAVDSNGYITFFTGGDTAGNERMRIINNGNVGIGTTSPGQKLVVGGTGSGGATLRIQDTGTAGGPAFSQLEFCDSSGAQIAMIGDSSTIDQNLYMRANNGGIHFSDSSGTSKMVLENGNIGIGITEPDEKLHVDGNAIIIGTGDPGVINLLIDGGHSNTGILFQVTDSSDNVVLVRISHKQLICITILLFRNFEEIPLP